MKYLIPICFLLIGIGAFGQDGSDMQYIKIRDFDGSYIGKWAHLDFYNRSFMRGKRDTISIPVNGVPSKFAEHRSDDGYNNWFRWQFLEALNYNEEKNKLFIEKWKIKQVTKDSIQVTGYFNLFNKKGEAVPGGSFTQDEWFSKDIIIEILIKIE